MIIDNFYQSGWETTEKFLKVLFGLKHLCIFALCLLHI